MGRCGHKSPNCYCPGPYQKCPGLAGMACACDPLDSGGVLQFKVCLGHSKTMSHHKQAPQTPELVQCCLFFLFSF